APNINEYLPEGSFINLSDFNSGDELLRFLKNMDDSVKSGYREKMKSYLNNHRDDPFSPLRMADLIVQEVEKA
ncbi:hypothetical protein KKI24_02215, partial [bacterium]|nr:hypothetical protein [bacterium]